MFHPHIAAELNRCRRADLLAAAGSSRRARALTRQQDGRPRRACSSLSRAFGLGRWRGAKLGPISPNKAPMVTQLRFPPGLALQKATPNENIGGLVR